MYHRLVGESGDPLKPDAHLYASLRFATCPQHLRLNTSTGGIAVDGENHAILSEPHTPIMLTPNEFLCVGRPRLVGHTDDHL